MRQFAVLSCLQISSNTKRHMTAMSCQLLAALQERQANVIQHWFTVRCADDHHTTPAPDKPHVETAT